MVRCIIAYDVMVKSVILIIMTTKTTRGFYSCIYALLQDVLDRCSGMLLEKSDGINILPNKHDL